MIHGQWAVSAIPAFGVIDQKGIVRHVAIGGGRYLAETIEAAKKLAASP